MAKDHRNLLRGEKGQITIFFSTVIVVMITIMAFIINIGIFVKAKINLQNATDAAAYAGASVQARQLTNIAYLNWEMRNVFKEWMFKYYVLGGLNLEGVTNQSLNGCGTKMATTGTNFTMCPYQTGPRPATDFYNFPSVCIDFANTGSVGLCTRYSVPGLPRFDSTRVLGMDEVTQAFVDTIVAQKSEDCTERTKLNFFTANTWAYNVVDEQNPDPDSISNLAPEIAANRLGAFPRAFEIGLRIRNLEAQVNKAPNNSVCIRTGIFPGCQGIEDIVAGQVSPSNERIYKAFFSGVRNIGSDEDSNLRNTFTLTEIAPQVVVSSELSSLSNLLIPSSAVEARNKRYLDLKLMPLNFATFYTMFTPNNDGTVNTSAGDATFEGECTATKMALPVPGYPMGFVKNPDLITYYAVKGEGSFVGLFNPFDVETIKLTAFSAAKPFGGRIGPSIFNVKDPIQVKPRTSPAKSSPYMMAFDANTLVDKFGIGTSDFQAGVPLPLNFGGEVFWADAAGTSVVGGFVGSSQATAFGVPNIAYDYPNNSLTQRSTYSSNSLPLGVIGARKPSNQAGLYNKDMFDKFKANLRGLGAVVTPDDIEDGILTVRGPTLLEAHNYLIPTPEVMNKEQSVDSFGQASGPVARTITTGTNEVYQFYQFDLYAPIFSSGVSDILYKSESDIEQVLNQYIAAQEPAVTKYIEAMGKAAQLVFQKNDSANTGQNLGASAARGLSDLDDAILADPNPAAVTGANPSCRSAAGLFSYFFLGDGGRLRGGISPECPTPFKEQMISRFNSFATGNNPFATVLPIEFAIKADDSRLREALFSAYRPGAEHDARQGIQINSLNGTRDTMKRNSYSVKFIALSSLVTNSQETYNKGAIISEGGFSSSIQEISPQGFNNPINPSQVGLDLQKVKY